MATTTAARRKPVQSATTDTNPGGGGTTGVTVPSVGAGAVANAQLLAFLRNNAQWLVAACTIAAAHASDQRDWEDMAIYNGLSESIARGFRIGQYNPMPTQQTPITRTASAGG